MSNKKNVKNRLSYSFGLLFSLMISFVLAEHVKNTVQLIEDDNQGSSIVTLAIAIFVWLFLEGFGIFSDFDITGKELHSSDINHELSTYIIWFLQFFPFYAMTYILTKTDETEVSRCQTVASSFGFVYLFYGVYQIVKLYIALKRKVKDNMKEASKHIAFYAFLTLMYSLLYFAIGRLIIINAYLILATAILILTLLYIYYWRKYYLDLLYEPTAK